MFNVKKKRQSWLVRRALEARNSINAKRTIIVHFIIPISVICHLAMTKSSAGSGLATRG